MRKQNIITRFEKYIMPEPNTGCWFWVARINQAGYGIFGDGPKKHKAHRFSFSIYRGEIPTGLFVCHSCDNPSCVNPDHLFLGTHSDNMRDMVIKGRSNNMSKHLFFNQNVAYLAIIKEAWILFGRGSQRKMAAYFHCRNTAIYKIANSLTYNRPNKLEPKAARYVQPNKSV